MMKKLLSVTLLLFSLSSIAGIQIKTMPLSFLVGLPNADFGLSIGNGVLSVGVVNGEMPSLFGMAIAVDEKHLRYDYFFSGAGQQGWYFGLGYSQLKADIRYSPITVGIGPSETYTGEFGASGPYINLGYRWLWTYFFLDLGYQHAKYKYDRDKLSLRSSNGDVEEKTIPSSAGAGGLDFSLGWYF